MKRNWHLNSKRLQMGLAITFLAGLLTSAWGESLPDLTLPPTTPDDMEVESSLSVPSSPIQPLKVQSARIDAELPVLNAQSNTIPAGAAPDPNEPPRPNDQPSEPPVLSEVAFPTPDLPTKLDSAPETTTKRRVKPLSDRLQIAEQDAPPLPSDEDATAEIIHERYPDGTLKGERGVKQDAEGNYILHGDWRLFDPKGTLLAEGRYVNNAREGEWKRFYRGDEVPLFATSPYKDFKGPFVSQAHFVNGKLEKTWTITDSKQRLVSEIDFQAGQRNGTARWFHPTGKVAHEVHYSQGRIEGNAEQWDPSGQLLRTEVYESGRRIGAIISNYPSGQKHVEAQCRFAPVQLKTADDWWSATLAEYETVGTDERHGRFTVWHSNGLKQREGEYVNAQPVGKMVWWYSNGQKQLQGDYENGQATGTWTWWHENGQKSIGGDFQANSPVGLWMWWREDGKVAQRIDLEQVKETERSALLKKFPLPTSPLR